MRVLAGLVLALVGGCSTENVQPLSEFGPIAASIDVDLGPLPEGAGDLDVNPRVFVAFDHSNPACPVFGDVDTSIDGVRPDALENGYYDDGSGWGDNHDPSCQPPYYSIDHVPPGKPTSILRLADATASYSMEVDRLFVNPAMTIATPLARGQVARIDVADDRQITKVDAMWWVGNSESATGYDVMATVAANGISFTMPTQVSGPGWLEVRVGLAAPQITCNGFSTCSATIKGSQRFEGTLQ
jgi:hypothetical protein